jgi:hypothetical protein
MLEKFFAEGLRAGHEAGKGRAGQYVIGEEYFPSYEAAERRALTREECAGPVLPCECEWARGFRDGYKIAAEGSELPASFQVAS